MQKMKMIMIPEERYNCMLESYDGAMEEILELSEENKRLKACEDPLLMVMSDDFRMSESMLKYAKNDEVITIRLICRRIRERMKSTDDVARELKLYDLMDEHGCDHDTAELLLQDQEESIARSQQSGEGSADDE